jgi:polysaccharide export outer membrane protein
MLRHWKDMAENLMVVVMLIALLSCASAPDEKINSLKIDSHDVRSLHVRETDRMNEQLIAAAKFNVDPSDYLLGAGDLIQMTVFESEELNTKVRVSSRGFITLPLLGQVRVKGMTAHDAEVHIENLYSENFIKNPHVSVFVEEHLSQRITLIGQFKQPGTYDYLSKMQLLDVMALAGGLNEKASRTAQIKRRSESGQLQTILIDLEKIIREGQSELNIAMKGGDVVFVPEAGMFFVDGAVRNPGAYHIKSNTKVVDAISVAGGLAPYAKTKTVILVRHMGKGERKVLELEMNDIDVQETSIQDRDLLLVRSSSVSKFFHGLGMTIGIPGVGGFGYSNPQR